MAVLRASLSVPAAARAASAVAVSTPMLQPLARTAAAPHMVVLLKAGRGHSQEAALGANLPTGPCRRGTYKRLDCALSPKLEELMHARL